MIVVDNMDNTGFIHRKMENMWKESEKHGCVRCAGTPSVIQ